MMVTIQFLASIWYFVKQFNTTEYLAHAYLTQFSEICLGYLALSAVYSPPRRVISYIKACTGWCSCTLCCPCCDEYRRRRRPGRGLSQSGGDGGTGSGGDGASETGIPGAGGAGGMCYSKCTQLFCQVRNAFSIFMIAACPDSWTFIAVRF